MRISIVLPGPARRPVGGYRVAYEYADRLAARGHQVCVVHDLKVPYLSYKKPYIVRSIGHRVTSGHIPKWFTFKHQVELTLVPEVSDKTMPEADVVIATWWGTAYSVAKLDPSKGSRFYLIQEYVMRGNDEERVHGSYLLGLRNIVIAEWIKKSVENAGGKIAAHIPNGIDNDHFRVTVPIEDRNPHSVAMMYHDVSFKGSRDGVAALKKVRLEIPDLDVTLFSVYPRPEWMPEWINFVHNPAQQMLVDIYNNALFVNPSTCEGWCLPPAESMACGCALVTTDIGGVRDYAFDDKTCLLSPPSDPDSLAANILRLVQDSDLRIKLARQGHEFIGRFGWDEAVDAMEDVLSGGQQE